MAPWRAQNSKEAYATGAANLATALGNRNADPTPTRPHLSVTAWPESTWA